MHRNIPLSRLTAGRRNPRRVRPEREAHRRLVASIRAHGLIEPLLVQPASGGGDDGTYRVIAGNRRLAALRAVHRGSDPEVACQVREVDRETADALSLSENFAREGMHPLDEAEAFARLASIDCQGVEAIAADFGVPKRYVRQRMKLAGLAEPVKAAFRAGDVDTATAEAFAAVPEDRQIDVWAEIDGNPQHAHHVRNVIANGWIDASNALFNVDALPEGAVSRDLFSERVLIERRSFMEAQAEALVAEREAFVEDGWNEVVIAARADVQDRLWSMAPAPVEYDEATAQRLAEIERRRQQLEAELEGVDESDEQTLDAAYQRFEALDEEEERLVADAPVRHSEATKARGTVFLILDPDGRVCREHRTPRASHTIGVNGHTASGVSEPDAPPAPPTSDDLSDRQKAPTYTHQALAVRAALLDDARSRRAVLALILHEKVRPGGLSVSRDTNATNLHSEHTEGFASVAREELRERRAQVDPFAEDFSLSDDGAYERLHELDDEQLEVLIDLLAVDCVTANLHHPTPLVRLLARELGVDVRRCWRPDAPWLNSYKKVQLAHLIGELRGIAHGSAAERRKKSELVAELAELFADAAEGRLDDPQLTERVNGWLPANLRPESDEAEADV